MERISEFTHWVGLGLNPGFAIYWASLMAQTVENLPAMQETQIPSLGKEDLLEKEMAVHSSYSCMENSWTEEPGRLQSMGPRRVGHNQVTNTLSLHYLLVV